MAILDQRVDLAGDEIYADLLGGIDLAQQDKYRMGSHRPQAAGHYGEPARPPLLIINGSADLAVPPADARRFFDAAPCDKELWMVPVWGSGLQRPAPKSIVSAWADAAPDQARHLRPPTAL